MADDSAVIPLVFARRCAREAWKLAGALTIVVVASACSGGGSNGGTASTATSPTAAAGTRFTPMPEPSATPALSSDSRLSVIGGAIGQNATATIRTTPGASCTIRYIAASGAPAADPNLITKTAGPDGVVSWSWRLAGRPGDGRVTVSCGGDEASAPLKASTP